nr:MAG TPA: activator clamp loader [Caudoviricetes sp.]
MAQSLATKYRPQDWEDVCSQRSVVHILNRQLETHNIKNSYLFAGASGCGKTTIARIFAKKINGNVGEPIEIDGASNNGVDNVKSIINAAKERSIDSEYKIYIIDECHALSNQAWQAFLKAIEEPPAYTIFMFCTTDPQKIPNTILNRVQRFNISRISTQQITERLKFICKQEGFTNYVEACEYIAKISDGGMRDAISTLEKCSGYSNDLAIQNVLESLGNYSYESFFELVNAIIDGNEKVVIKTIDDFYNKGNDLKIFVDKFFTFIMDIDKYALFNDVEITSIPSNYEGDIKRCVAFENPTNYYSYLLDKLLNVKQVIKDDSNLKNTVIVMFLQMTRCQ